MQVMCWPLIRWLTIIIRNGNNDTCDVMQVMVDLGFFPSAVEAARARDCAALGLNPHVRLNFKPSQYTWVVVLVYLQRG
jgi:hypothetical protein